MKARRLIDGASFEPRELKIVTAAFDVAWEKIAPTVSSRDTAIEAARLKLADVILGIASNGITDAKEMADAALERMLEAPAGIKATFSASTIWLGFRPLCHHVKFPGIPHMPRRAHVLRAPREFGQDAVEGIAVGGG